MDIFTRLNLLKGNPLALLVGMYTDTTTIEQPYDSGIPLRAIYPEKTIIENWVILYASELKI